MLVGFVWNWIVDKEGNCNGEILDVIIEEYYFVMFWNVCLILSIWVIYESGIN